MKMRKSKLVIAGLLLLPAQLAHAEIRDGKCIVGPADVTCSQTAWTNLCSTPLQQFTNDPGNGVTSIRINSASVTLDTNGAAGVGFGYEITANCDGQTQIDPHAIAAEAIPETVESGPYPAVGLLLWPSKDPLGKGNCTVTMKCKSFGGPVIVKADQDHAQTGVDDASAFHIEASY